MGLLGKLTKITLKTATIPVNVAMDLTGVNLFTQSFDEDKSFFSTYDKMKSIAEDIEDLDDD